MARTIRTVGLITLVLTVGAISCRKGGYAPGQPAETTAVSTPTSGGERILGEKVSLDGKPGGDSSGKLASAKKKPAMPRKIIRNGEISLVVKSYAPARQAIESMVETSRGYISSSNVQHRLGRVSSATVVIRVPASRFPGAMKLLARLGVVQREATSSKDITDQYYDLRARLSNARKLEQRFLVLLEKHTGKVSDLLAVERELARVRGQIEVFEGKLRLFDNLVDLSTITINLSIREKYTPPRAPSLWNDMGQVLSNSLDTMKAFGRGLLLVIVALAPWLLPPLLVIITVVTVVVRRQRRQANKK